ncbi:MAG: outer membrane protein assembly factor BamD [Flavobacteriales bacterium Tduv]
MQKKCLGILAIVCLSLSGCNKNLENALKRSDKDYILSKAYRFYDQKKYSEALHLFEYATPLVGESEETKDLIYKTAMANYYDKNYILAGYQFYNFQNTYPRDTRAEEALYQSAYCYYLASPDYNLDQKITYRSIKELQNFINQYPNTSKTLQANILIQELTKKLEKKTFEIAKLYHDITRYKAAIVSFQNFINDYPDSNLKEKAFYYMLNSQYELAVNSREDLKKKRLEKTVTLCNKFKKEYPDSERADDVEKIFQKIQHKFKIPPF